MNATDATGTTGRDTMDTLREELRKAVLAADIAQAEERAFDAVHAVLYSGEQGWRSDVCGTPCPECGAQVGAVCISADGDAWCDHYQHNARIVAAGYDPGDPNLYEVDLAFQQGGPFAGRWNAHDLADAEQRVGAAYMRLRHGGDWTDGDR